MGGGGGRRYLFAIGDSTECTEVRRYLGEIWPPYILIQVVVINLQIKNHELSFQTDDIIRTGPVITALKPEHVSAYQVPT
jgi:hypothetical protein